MQPVVHPSHTIQGLIEGRQVREGALKPRRLPSRDVGAQSLGPHPTPTLRPRQGLRDHSNVGPRAGADGPWLSSKQNPAGSVDFCQTLFNLNEFVYRQ